MANVLLDELLALEDEDEDEDDEFRCGIILLTLAGELEMRQQRADRRRPVRGCLTRSDLPQPRGDTSWQHLLAARNDRAFITTMGFDVATFTLILQAGFQTAWETTPIERSDVHGQGLPRLAQRSLDAAGGLGLCLHYIHSCMTTTSLQQIFGLIPSTVDRYINFGLNVLEATLGKMPLARVSWPVEMKMKEYEGMILERHGLLEGAFGSIDGLNLTIEVPDDPGLENATYNSWTHGHYSSQVFVFAPDGTILHAVLNAPGSWHDSRIARPIYQKLISSTPDGYYLVADTAFPHGTHQVNNKIKAPLKSGDKLPRSLLACTECLALDRQLLSYRQTAEWGMRAIQGGFGRLRVPLHVNPEKRLRLLHIITRAFNLRVRCVGISQIRAVYCDIWREADGDNVWSNFASMMFGDLRRNDRVARFHTMAVET